MYCCNLSSSSPRCNTPWSWRNVQQWDLDHLNDVNCPESLKMYSEKILGMAVISALPNYFRTSAFGVRVGITFPTLLCLNGTIRLVLRDYLWSEVLWVTSGWRYSRVNMCLRLFRAFSELADFIRLLFFQVWSMSDYKERSTPASPWGPAGQGAWAGNEPLLK